MARSIYDWYAHRASQADESFDDEEVERQAPWDLVRSNRARLLDGGSPRRGAAGARKSRASSPAAHDETGVTGRVTPGSPKAPSTVPRVPVSASSLVKIKAMAASYPGIGAKGLASKLRKAGIEVTKAQVADVLRDRTSRSRTVTTPAPPRPASLGLRYRKAAKVASRQQSQSRRIAGALNAALPLCDACGVRVNLNGVCRCT